MRGPHRMTFRRLDQLADRSVGRDRIAARQDGPERKPAVVIGDEAGTQRRPLRLVGRLLRIVEPVIVGMPDIDFGIRERLAFEIGDAAADEHRLPADAGRDIRAMRHRLVFADIEWTKHRRLGRAFAFAVIYGIDQHRDAEHV